MAYAVRESDAVSKTMEVITGKWTLLIIRSLMEGTKRFSELERTLVACSPRTLAQRLRQLEVCGIITRQTFAEVPPRVEYTITAAGMALVPLIEAMEVYGDTYLKGMTVPVSGIGG